MDISKLTSGQKQFLLESLTNQKSKKTTAEVKILFELRNELSEVVAAGHYGDSFLRVGKFIRLIEIDTFGEDYRNRWVKIKENGKGEFFNISYLGNQRIFLD